MPTRDDLPPLERAVSDALDEVNNRMHGLTSSWAYPEEFLEWLGDAGFEVVATTELAELRREAAQAAVLATGIGDHLADFEAASARVERVRVLHELVPDSAGPFCLACTPVAAIKYPKLIKPWPCPTIRALDGPAVPKEQTGSGNA